MSNRKKKSKIKNQKIKIIKKTKNKKIISQLFFKLHPKMIFLEKNKTLQKKKIKNNLKMKFINKITGDPKEEIIQNKLI
jgi:hypothetical protein